MGGPRGAGGGRALQKPVALYMGTKCSLMPLAACGSDASFLKDGISSPFPTSRGLQAALKCSYRSDSVTRDWPLSFKSARCKGQDEKGLGGWACPGGHDGRHEGVVRQDAGVPPAERQRGANFQEARSASHECGTSSSADDDAGHACFASQHTRFSARARFPPRPRSTRALILATKRGTQHRCAVILLSATTTV